MGLFAALKSLFARADEAGRDTAAFDPERFVYVKIPGDIQPMARGERFEDPLQALLADAGLGEVSGGGSSLSEADADGRRTIAFCGIDIDVADREPALDLLRAALPGLSIVPGTELQYTRDGRALRDVYVHGVWSIAQPRDERHPGFGV